MIDAKEAESDSEIWWILGHQRSDRLRLVPSPEYKLLRDSDDKPGGIISRNRNWD